MTVIAYKETEDGFTLASDSQGSTLSGFKEEVGDGDQLYEDSNKIFDVNDVIAGVAGSADVARLFNLFCKTHKPKGSTENDMVDFLVEFKKYLKDIDKDIDMNIQAIIVYENTSYRVWQFEVQEINDYSAVGSGMDLALGALHFGHSAEAAVEAAKKHNLYCGGETVTITG